MWEKLLLFHLCNFDVNLGKPLKSLSQTDKLILACWLNQNNQNKVITILFFAQYFCRNKSSPIRTLSSHNNAFVARVFLSLDFAICLFPQFLTSMRVYVAFFPQFRQSGGHGFAARRVFFHEFSPRPQFCALCFIVSAVWGRLENGFRGFPQKGENSATVSSSHVSRKA